MCNKRTALLSATALFLAAEITLSVLLQVSGGRVGIVCSFAAIALACLFCLLFAERSSAYLFTQLALVCTVCADYFLVLSSPRQQLPAMLFFSVTQLAYAARLYIDDASKRRRAWQIGCRIGFSLVALLLTVLVLREKTDALALVSLFYYANLLVNILFAFTQLRGNALMAVGLLLFACCDTLIGLSCLGQYFPIAEDSLLYRVINPGFNLAWAFYVPSQALLALSLLPNRLKR